MTETLEPIPATQTEDITISLEGSQGQVFSVSVRLDNLTWTEVCSLFDIVDADQVISEDGQLPNRFPKKLR